MALCICIPCYVVCQYEVCSEYAMGMIYYIRPLARALGVRETQDQDQSRLEVDQLPQSIQH